MSGSRLHLLKSGDATFVHKHEKSRTTRRDAEFTSVSLFMPVAASHEELITHRTRHQCRVSPQHGALGAILYREPSLGDVQQFIRLFRSSIRIEPIPSKIADSPTRLNDVGSLQKAGL